MVNFVFHYLATSHNSSIHDQYWLPDAPISKSSCPLLLDVHGALVANLTAIDLVRHSCGLHALTKAD